MDGTERIDRENAELDRRLAAGEHLSEESEGYRRWRGRVPESDTTVEEEPEECEGCGYAGAPLEKHHPLSPRVHREVWLCEVCSSTLTGNIVLYRTNYGEAEPVLRTICYVTNMILAVLKEKSIVLFPYSPVIVEGPPIPAEPVFKEQTCHRCGLPDGRIVRLCRKCLKALGGDRPQAIEAAIVFGGTDD